ncbi:alpha/beta fold hydrolase [Exiguobacterium antarcticum]|uniref:Alpha/beta fold hydrolase n=1 Tax=Exiguobacterium antarcticum TaxID=132920 RepID=A0ABT6R0J8_9BACL|nr:alpha/beta fold hydrolase [Exiguobacterium antarcticum]MDI3234327.1 alpha/beta fold hydrolase [Exiguobacterium antarcticum]
MRLLPPKPFYYEGGERAVLLLHSFTSNPNDMKKLGSYLQQNQYSCYAPTLSGHGLPTEDLLSHGPVDWWQDALNGYQLLKDKGYERLAVVGLSLGGVLALKMGQESQVNGIVTMSVPMYKEAAVLKERIIYYARRYKQLEGKKDQQIASEMAELDHLPFDSLTDFEQIINRTRDQLARVVSPVCVLYGELDDPSYKTSAETIFESVALDQKAIKGFAHSKHLMTLGKDMNAINQDILAFLNKLNW